MNTFFEKQLPYNQHVRSKSVVDVFIGRAFGNC